MIPSRSKKKAGQSGKFQGHANYHHSSHTCTHSHCFHSHTKTHNSHHTHPPRHSPSSRSLSTYHLTTPNGSPLAHEIATFATGQTTLIISNDERAVTRRHGGELQTHIAHVPHHHHTSHHGKKHGLGKASYNTHSPTSKVTKPDVTPTVPTMITGDKIERDGTQIRTTQSPTQLQGQYHHRNHICAHTQCSHKWTQTHHLGNHT